MNSFDTFELASSDINRNQCPARINGTFYFPPGLERIMGQDKFKVIRTLTSDITSLENQRHAHGQEMLHLQKPSEQCKKERIEKGSALKKDLQMASAELAIKNADLQRHKDHMVKRGIVLEEDQLEQDQKEPKLHKPKKMKNWVLPVAIFAIYFVIEGFTYVTQIDSLRDVMSYEEVAARVLSMLVVLILFHVISHMARKRPSIIYRITLGFFLLMITTMMFAPTTVHYMYPSGTHDTAAEEWSFNEDAISSANSSPSVSNPTWVGLYRKMEWTPAALCILVFLIVFFVLPNPIFNQQNQDNPEEHRKNEGAFTIQKDNPAKTVWQQLKNEVRGLLSKKETIEVQMKQHESSDPNIVLLLNKLESLKQNVDKIDQLIVSKKINREEHLKSLEADINDYRADYQDILAGDAVKSAILTPEWPTKNDVINYFKILNR